MKEILLQQQVNGFEEVYFTVGNIVTIIGGVISTLTAYFALKYGQKSNENDIGNLKEELLSAKNGRYAIKKELSEKVKEVDEHNRARIDKTQQEMRNYKDKTDEEFKAINSSISKVQQDTSNILGKLDALLNKN